MKVEHYTPLELVISGNNSQDYIFLGGLAKSSKDKVFTFEVKGYGTKPDKHLLTEDFAVVFVNIGFVNKKELKFKERVKRLNTAIMDLFR